MSITVQEAMALSMLPAASRVAAQEYMRGQSGREATFEEVVGAAVQGPMPGRFAHHLRAEAAPVLDAALRRAPPPLVWGTDPYPPLLAAVADAPFLLWVRGDVSALSGPAIAVVGSRAATPYGLEAAHRLGGDLAAAGLVVVSGLARGVDSAAHRGALSAGGRTVAVLGSGIDVIYPREHDRLADDVAASGAVAAECRPGTSPSPRQFPARNRIISGLSLGIVVVEAAEKSGSLITAGFALEQGRLVMAVPGSVLSGRHRGCHALLRDGAVLVESAEDVLSELRGCPLARVCGRPEPEGGVGDPVLAVMLAGESYDVDALTAQTELPTAPLLARLLDLELRGAVRRVDGGRFVRAGRTC